MWTCPRTSRDPLEQTKIWLRQGKIVAVKGVGGFHLLVDATHAEAIDRLRLRKHRPRKPLALMARNMAVIRRYCQVGEEEERALHSPQRPIVLLEAAGPEVLPAELAPELNVLGFMLPYTPLYHLLLKDFDTPLVATSANPSGAPLGKDNDEAVEQLQGIADAFLLHDREIVLRCDDSVVRYTAGRMRLLRSARGYAPVSLSLPSGFEAAKATLALGGELKNTFCLLHRGRAVLSPHLGDLEDARTFAWYREEMTSLRWLFGFRPWQLAIDGHPDYHSSKLGRDLAEREGVKLVQVQHHHAHLAACLAEHGHPLGAGPVLGLILDGLGYGNDDTYWGAELLWSGYRSFRRLTHLRPAPLPGGARAMVEPWRNLVARLWQTGIDSGLFPSLTGRPVETLQRMLQKRFNSPLASSCGRLFDAVAAALGICSERQSYEGEAAAMLEHLALRSDDGGIYPFQIGTGEVDPAPLWPAIARDLHAGIPREVIARRFHNGLAHVWKDVVRHWGDTRKCRTVVLSGGVFQNRLLLETLHDSLKAMDFTVWTAEKIPLNDGGLSLGQAVVAAALSTGDQ